MTKAHDIREARMQGTVLHLRIDGALHAFDVTRHSQRLAQATPAEREHFEISPSGYGIHWPVIDEDLSIDGLLGIRHSRPLAETG